MNESDLSAARWKKSSYSNGQANCVEVANNLPGVVAVRDSKNPGGPVLVFTAEEWQAFVASLRAKLA
jgi:hypothetical protein